MADYRFRSFWVIEAAAVDAFDALRAFQDHPRWWRHVEGTSQQAAHRVGYAIRSPLGYTLRFDIALEHAVRPSLIETRAVGELSGSGLWRISEAEGITVLDHTWTVATTKPWMNAVAPVARPGFRWAHDRVMESGARGLARELGGRLLAFT